MKKLVALVLIVALLLPSVPAQLPPNIASMLPFLMMQGGGGGMAMQALLPLILPSLMNSMGEGNPIMQFFMMQKLMQMFGGGQGGAGAGHGFP